MSGRPFSTVVLQYILRPRPLRSPASRLTAVTGIVGFTLAISLITTGRWAGALVVFAMVTSLLALMPPLAWLAKPVAAYVGLWIVFNVLRASADDTAWADQVLGLVPRLEAWLVGGRLPSAVLQERFHQAGVIAWHDYGLAAIYLSFFIVPHLVAALLLWRNRRLFWTYTLATATLFTMAIVSFFVIPTSPPWLISSIETDATFASIQRITEPALTGLDLPAQLFSEGTRDGVRTSEVRVEPNPIAAMPSIHFAMTAMIAFPARHVGPPFVAIAVAYALLMGIALVYLGEHYVVDLIAGGAMAAIGWETARRWVDRVRTVHTFQPHGVDDQP